jgi:hypothetical protein
MAIKTSWTKGLEDDQAERIRGAFKASSELRERLSLLCEEKIATAMSTHKAQYDSSSWAYLQADAIGYRRALEEIISLLEK